MDTLQPGDRLGILTSGGDSPGMNAAVRAGVRVALDAGLEVLGIEDGYRGLLENRMGPITLRALDESVRRGGTLLGTARSPKFATPEGQVRAKEVLQNHGIKALLVIGGNGSLTGAQVLAQTMQGQLRVAGLPASIDNDLACTSMAIGVDTAMNTIVEAIDRICDTADAHRRTFLVEVMGRDCGYLAMTCAIAAGADAVLVREAGRDDDALVQQVVATMRQAYGSSPGKRRVIVIKAEGVRLDIAQLKHAVDQQIHLEFPDVETRVTVLGHVVRGGAPSAFDRLLGARLAHAAVRALCAGDTEFMAGWSGPDVTGPACEFDPYVVLTPLGTVLAETDKLMAGLTPIARWRQQILLQNEAVLRM